MFGLFNREPVRVVDGIYDFVAGSDDYVENYEELARDRKGDISVETGVLGNIIQVLTEEQPPQMLLDVGCGDGHVLSLANAQYKVALDISLERLQQLKFVANVKARANGEHLPFYCNSFDAVLCLDIIEHVRYPFTLLSEMRRVLRVGGFLYFACPWYQDLSVYTDPRYIHEYKQYKYKHLRSIGAEDLAGYFAGYRIISSTTITAAAKYMKFRPYSIVFHKLKLREDYED